MSARMRAAVLHGKRDVRVERVLVPRPGDGEVLIRTKAALTCGTDAKVYRRGYHARMIVPPSLFGHEVAGIVEEVGPGVSGWEPGARVVAANSAPCGQCAACRRGRLSLCDDLLFWNGAYAEFACLPARIVSRNLLRLPDVPFHCAALVEPLACVVRGMDACAVQPGDVVVVIGTGPIGLMFVNLARGRGARVIAVGRHPQRLEKAREVGAERVIVAGPEIDIADAIWAETDGAGADTVIEAAGQVETAQAAVRAVRKGGIVNLFAGCPAGTTVSVDAQTIHYQEVTITSTFHHTPDSVRAALDLIVSGTINPELFIDGTASLERVPQILEEMGHGRRQLKTVIVPEGTL
jgi:L-iditol 2-dehydrogenase